MVQEIVAVSAEAGAGVSNDPAMAFLVDQADSLVDQADSLVDQADSLAGAFADRGGSLVGIVGAASLVGRVDFPAVPAAVIAAEVEGLALQRAARNQPKIGSPDSRACFAVSTQIAMAPSIPGKSLRTGGVF